MVDRKKDGSEFEGGLANGIGSPCPKEQENLHYEMLGIHEQLVRAEEMLFVGRSAVNPMFVATSTIRDEQGRVVLDDSHLQ